MLFFSVIKVVSGYSDFLKKKLRDSDFMLNLDIKT